MEYVTAGMALTPIPLGRKGPNKPGWNQPQNAITTIDAAENITGNLGLLHVSCRRPTACIDIDDLESAFEVLGSEGINLKQLLDAPHAVQICSGRSNRGKLLYALPPDVSSLTTIQIADPVTGKMVVEFRSASSGGKSMTDVLPPSIHPDTGRAYTWGGRGHWSQPPELPSEILDYWKQQLGKMEYKQSNTGNDTDSGSIVTLPPESIQHLRGALLHIRADLRADWINIGMALHELGEVGRGLWLEWSATSEKFDAPDAAKTWESFSPNKIGYKSVFTVRMQCKTWSSVVRGLFCRLYVI